MAWNEAFRVNVSGAFLCSKRALPHMKKQGAGTIVNIGSVSGVSPYVGGGAYAATKAALAMLTRVLALEAGPFGVTANCICPGSIQHRTGGRGSAAHIPVGRAGTIDDVASVVIYLASAEARYMTGATATHNASEQVTTELNLQYDSNPTSRRVVFPGYFTRKESPVWITTIPNSQP